MNKATCILAGIVIGAAMAANAQDPGARDSVIIDTVNAAYMPNGGTVFVHVWFVTDDSIVWVNLPLSWTSSDGMIFPGRTVWRETFTQWDDCYDTLLQDRRLLRQIAFSDIGGEDNPPLLTDGQRLWGMDLRFIILPGADSRQFVAIDTTVDPINGPIDFGGPHGWYSFMPAFRSGFIRYDFQVGIDREHAEVPAEFALGRNYPNPFNPETIIEFQLPISCRVALEIYNLLGQKVITLVSEEREAGFHTVRWDGTSEAGAVMPSGIYFYRLTAGDFSETKKMIMLR